MLDSVHPLDYLPRGNSRREIGVQIRTLFTWGSDS
jgi:hypothetical protein